MSADENIADECDVSAAPAETQTKPAKDRKNRKEKVKPLAKVIVRRLPPTMTEEDFLKQIEPVPDHDYFYFVSADWSLGVNATCRAYINFCNQSDIFIFRDKFDGYVFVDSRGSEYQAIVEFAPFQGLPKGKSRKKDHKANTIETEPHYLAFLDSLKDEETDGKSEMKMEYSFQIKDDQKITSTPLLEYLANVRQERRDERKRKTEDRKRVREEEKQRKKNQVAKSIPKTIDEDTQENDDGIIVRVIKSRPLERDKNRKERSSDASKSDKSKESTKNDTGTERSRSERERQRNKERQARRKEERERAKKEKEEKRIAEAVKSEAPSTSANAKEGKESGRRQRESRRDRRQQAEQSKTSTSGESKDARNNSAKTASKTSSKSEADPKENNADEKRLSPTDENKGSTSTEAQAALRAREKERAITNLRNKDRPSLQIYQPGKRRSSQQPLTPEGASESKPFGDEAGSASADSSKDSKSTKSATNTNSDKHEKQSNEGSKIINTKNANQSDGKKQKDEPKKSTATSNEKRISRYSEKRNKAKEKRDTVAGEDTVTDVSNAANAEGKARCDENS